MPITPKGRSANNEIRIFIMGEAKRRKQLDPNFGLTFKNPRNSDVFPYSIRSRSLEEEEMGLPGQGESLDCYLNKDAIQTLVQLVTEERKSIDLALDITVDRFGMEIFNQRYFQTCEKSQGLFALWFDMVNYSQTASLFTDVQSIIKWWKEYWTKAITILGRVNIGDPLLFPWFRRLKGIILFVLEEIANSLTKSSALEFALALEAESQFLSLGETTLEIGLAFDAKNIIYAGEAITVYKGVDSARGKGELMIAVKHASGCWSHYPLNENAPVPFSDYKKAKIELKNFPTSLRGELIHTQSRKLAKLLGLSINGNYAYLIKEFPHHKKFMENFYDEGFTS
jgi:hypothetical protein